MFYYLSGTLALAAPGLAVVDVGGVGYKLTISENTYAALPRRGLTDAAAPGVKLYTYMAVREDDIELFGFASEAELSSFRMLLGVSGVGPKAAMAILSILTPEKFALAVCMEDRKAIAKASGIGPKTAARIVLELKDKLQKQFAADAGDLPDAEEAEFVAATGGKGKLAEAQDALLVLGYTRQEAVHVLKSIPVDQMSVEDIIKEALKKMM
ncbi:holliday junction ATP-dependent DNA helicase RuvA [Clostridium sp. CAG:448]|nr:holliday junction ATP-dependent DNA helicase RuvA [Clostridium sp. CAG:448]